LSIDKLMHRTLVFEDYLREAPYNFPDLMFTITTDAEDKDGLPEYSNTITRNLWEVYNLAEQHYAEVVKTLTVAVLDSKLDYEKLNEKLNKKLKKCKKRIKRIKSVSCVCNL